MRDGSAPQAIAAASWHLLADYRLDVVDVGV